MPDMVMLRAAARHGLEGLHDATAHAPRARRNLLVGLWAARHTGCGEADLIPYALAVMEADSKVFRKDKPFAFTNLLTDEGLEKIQDWIRGDVLMLDLA